MDSDKVIREVQLIRTTQAVAPQTLVVMRPTTPEE